MISKLNAAARAPGAETQPLPLGAAASVLDIGGTVITNTTKNLLQFQKNAAALASIERGLC
jgi:hypothetical protein